MMLRTIAYCLICGAVMLVAAAGAGALAWWYIAGVAYAAAFVPVALRGPHRLSARLGVIWLAAMITSVLCLWTEALIFVRANPHPWRALGSSVFLFSVMAVALAVIAGLLGIVQYGEAPKPRLHRPGRVVVGLLVSGVAYLIYYFVFGSIFFQLLFKQYYIVAGGPLSDPQTVMARVGFWLPIIQVGRGALMAASVLPIVGTLRMSRRGAAVAVGMLLWVIGGLALLIPPNSIMPLQLRMFHTVEIFTQNFLLGVTAVLLTRHADAEAGLVTAAGAEG